VSRRPVDHPTGYARPDQMWAALTARIKTIAPAGAVAELQRQFLYERFLARVFTHAPDPWVLKGGTALLARVRDARHSRDVDLNRTTGTLDAAVQEIRAAAVTDLDDHVRFVTTARRIGPTRAGRSEGGTACVEITPYIGVRPMHAFGVDIVVGTLLTTNPDLHQPTPVVPMPGITTPPYRLYSVVDHVADKVCATMELYNGRPSSRHRDLVDLVIIACTQTVDATALGHAIKAERLHRELPPITAWNCPPQWATPYATAARTVTHCADYRTSTTGTALVAHFLDPVLSGELTTGATATGVVPMILGDLKPDYADQVRALGGQVVSVGRGRGYLNPLAVGALGSILPRLRGRPAYDRVAAEVAARRLSMTSGLVSLVRREEITDTEQTIIATALRLLDEHAAATGDPTPPLLTDLVEVIKAGGSSSWPSPSPTPSPTTGRRYAACTCR